MLLTPWGCQTSITSVSCENHVKRQARKGTTALEYLVCISTILIVVIITVQQLGSMVGNKFANNAKATAVDQ